MSTFAKTAFNSLTYAAGRPTYPQKLFDFIFAYHVQSPLATLDRAVDLGCGTGQATTPLTHTFRHVVGIDPSKSMIEAGRSHIASLDIFPGQGNIQFKQGHAEDLTCIDEAGSVDLVIAAQACHWFDYAKVYPQLARILRPGGVFAFWCYSELRLPRYPSITPLITSYFQGSDIQDSIGPYWQRPGRTILENHLTDIPDLNQLIPGQFCEFTRVHFTGEHYLPPQGMGEHQRILPLLPSTITWPAFLTYLKSSSAYCTYQEKFPDDKGRLDGDIAERFYKRVKGMVEAEKKRTGHGMEDGVEVEWPVSLVLSRRI